MKKSFNHIIFLLVFFMVPMLALAHNVVHGLRFGMKSTEVTLLQQKLQTLGYFPKTISLSGYFGLVTKKAVIAFQKSEGIIATGFVGPLTQNTLEAKTAVAEVHNVGEGGLNNYPDEPLSSIPTNPISVKFLIEHRTALRGKVVTVQGYIVNALLGKAACPDMGGPCAQPRIFLADTLDQGRNKDYDLMVLLKERDAGAGYSVGQNPVILGIVSSSKAAVDMIKS